MFSVDSGSNDWSLLTLIVVWVSWYKDQRLLKPLGYVPPQASILL